MLIIAANNPSIRVPNPEPAPPAAAVERRMPCQRLPRAKA